MVVAGEVIGSTPITFPTPEQLTTMELIKADGAPATTEKVVHEPRAFRRDRDQLEAELKRLQGEYLVDVSPKEGDQGTAVPDLAAARRKYGHEYAETVHKLKKHNVALQADDQVMYNWIDAVQAQATLRMKLATPMEELKDGLRAFDFVPLAECVYGQLWLAVNDAHWVAIAISGTGISTLFFGLGEVPALVALIDAAELSPQCRQPKWTMNEVTLLMRAMRWQKVKAPEPVMLQAALAELPKTRKKLFPWT
jgi:hypothetical protein